MDPNLAEVVPGRYTPSGNDPLPGYNFLPAPIQVNLDDFINYQPFFYNVLPFFQPSNFTPPDPNGNGPGGGPPGGGPTGGNTPDPNDPASWGIPKPTGPDVVGDTFTDITPYTFLPGQKISFYFPIFKNSQGIYSYSSETSKRQIVVTQDDIPNEIHMLGVFDLPPDPNDPRPDKHPQWKFSGYYKLGPFPSGAFITNDFTYYISFDYDSKTLTVDYGGGIVKSFQVNVRK